MHRPIRKIMNFESRLVSFLSPVTPSAYRNNQILMTFPYLHPAVHLHLPARSRLKLPLATRSTEDTGYHSFIRYIYKTNTSGYPSILRSSYSFVSTFIYSGIILLSMVAFRVLFYPMCLRSLQILFFLQTESF